MMKTIVIENDKLAAVVKPNGIVEILSKRFGSDKTDSIILTLKELEEIVKQAKE